MTDDFSFSQETFILLGKIGKPHGLKGEVKLHTYSDELQALLHYPEVVLVDSKGQLSPVLKVEKSRLQGKTAVFKLATVDSRETAEAILGRGILIDKKNLPPVEDNEYYWYQLENLPVRTDSGRELGKVKYIFSNGAQDIMVVGDGKQEFMIPILDTIIREHNKEGVVITPPPGLLEINTGKDA